MKRLRKLGEEFVDRFLGSPIEIINNKSRYYGYYGWIDNEYHNDKYKVLIKPKYDYDGKKWIPLYVEYHRVEYWVRIVPEELLKD